MHRYRIYVFLMGVICIVSLNIVLADSVQLPLVGKIIFIDAGHGGIDPGTIHNDIYEKNINLAIASKLKVALEKKGATVLMTRDGDYDLASPNATFRKKSDFDNRILLINNSHADLYLSIHQNYLSNSSYFGPQVFYTPSNIKLASTMQTVLNDELNDSRKIKNMPDIYMYKKLNVPGILIECGFLSNASDRQKLNSNDYQQKLAEVITNGVIIYFT